MNEESCDFPADVLIGATRLGEDYFQLECRCVDGRCGGTALCQQQKCVAWVCALVSLSLVSDMHFSIN